MIILLNYVLIDIQMHSQEEEEEEEDEEESVDLCGCNNHAKRDFRTESPMMASNETNSDKLVCLNRIFYFE